MENINLSLENWDKLLRHPRIGEILVQHKKITIHQLEKALKEQGLLKIPVGQILLQMKFITKDELLELLELQIGISKMLNESFDELKNSNNKDQVNNLIETLDLKLDSEPDLH
ncbi:MAG: hypothetical protein A2287_06105 [Candidatus Melainabacteria bacterium RIFOXYA12_FULL_32_12]|nr:MAG: hypothetical protein A2255_03505 [Candidatus Melainabacteria bacterium RIFOXYA2_FULL_32_9]OGI27775.1 MAG: hypothetical protein A2287_06105 [Candidatus Melainabacteria bacterium RIFOXYA12_FULL_32_12]